MIRGLQAPSLPQPSCLLQLAADGKAPLKRRALSRLMFLLNGMATQNQGKQSRPSQVIDYNYRDLYILEVHAVQCSIFSTRLRPQCNVEKGKCVSILQFIYKKKVGEIVSKILSKIWVGVFCNKTPV